MATTDHSADILALRNKAQDPSSSDTSAGLLTLSTAADLLELHDQTGISLDHWVNARSLVELLIGHRITENGC